MTKINDAYCPNKTVDTDVTYTDADGNQVSLKGKKVLDAANCAVGEDGQLPPRELFTRVGMDRYTKVTGDAGYFLQSFLELAPRAGMEDENEVVPGGSALINMAGEGRGGGNADAEGGQNAGYFRNDARLVHHLEAEDRKSTRLNSSHQPQSRMPSSA